MGNLECVLITMGLPGSGKTSFANEVRSANETHVIHLDEIRERHYSYHKEYNACDYIRKGMSGWRGQPQVLLDGLFLTNNDLFNAITTLSEYAARKMYVIIHRWEADRDTCLKNDGGRREKRSTKTILNAKYEEVDLESLNERLKVYGADYIEVSKIIRHDVVLKPDWIRYFKTHVGFGSDGKLRSERWSLGGKRGSCYGGTYYSDGEEPLEFDELENLLESKCPNLLHRHYRYIWKDCVRTEETTEDEYYGGYTNYMNWVCDLEKLYQALAMYGYTTNSQS
jgi:hypothetical protein